VSVAVAVSLAVGEARRTIGRAVAVGVGVSASVGAGISVLVGDGVRVALGGGVGVGVEVLTRGAPAADVAVISRPISSVPQPPSHRLQASAAIRVSRSPVMEISCTAR
jgi:hypothetical protein